MSAKTSPARRRAFFKALAETGNRTLAAERAKVSQSWVTLHRSTDPAFRAEMEAARAEAKATLAAADPRAPGTRYRGGEELVVRTGRGRQTQLGRARVKQWTPRTEARFLEALAGSCNVKLACAAVGLTPASAYNHRERWTGFAERWDAALAAGHMRLEGALLVNGWRMLGDGDPDDGDVPLIPMTFADALNLLKLHQGRVHGAGKRPGRWVRPRTLDDIRGSILRKLEAIIAMRDEDAVALDAAAGGGGA